MLVSSGYNLLISLGRHGLKLNSDDLFLSSNGLGYLDKVVPNVPIHQWRRIDRSLVIINNFLNRRTSCIDNLFVKSLSDCSFSVDCL